jgi:hypothetical protein
MIIIRRLISPANPNRRGRVSTVDLLVLTSSDQLLLILKMYFSFFTKQPILIRRSTVLNLPDQIGVPAPSNLLTLGLTACTIKLFTTVIIFYSSKLECLLRSPTSTFRVRLGANPQRGFILVGSNLDLQCWTTVK